ncbi:MAG: DUF1127 domain-containing protein [Rhodospirillum sp.]|nr:DUF1127 domain-containing protein [Rhodospirillum sp.]MCF8489248.1 DUF1127 domain-containing protein [Rhodospirillum sp.]MCF8502578.1 DUF1127 domain-containing protein [Rhodospirillum sp.]
MNRIGRIRLLLARFGLWLGRQAQRRDLARLDPSLLDDLGLSEEERRRECGKWR